MENRQVVFSCVKRKRKHGETQRKGCRSTRVERCGAIPRFVCKDWLNLYVLLPIIQYKEYQLLRVFSNAILSQRILYHEKNIKVEVANQYEIATTKIHIFDFQRIRT
uniref:AlNc14C147G7424 protein n=1 Tax=Albugo laibachii Nc14 TaxID=890382 RepID=F0WLN6_9STRA|nr:AlNc14C147G7424 [Albugo laibachii Nc14]|eukprot:CCA22202.1 AlNc14C147G7424 [Albugo laibachii Nc14]